MGIVVDITEKLKLEEPEQIPQDVQTALQKCIDWLNNGDSNPKKCLIIMLDDENFCYDVSYCTAFMKPSETLSLVEVFKACIIRDLDYAPNVGGEGT